MYRNIAAFGGDPENITIFGQSAGAGSVQTLMTSDLTGGMIKKAIIQSGVSVPGQKPEAFRTKTVKAMEQQGLEIMKLAGCADIHELRQKSYEDLQNLPGMGFGGKYSFGTVIDGYLVKKSSEDVIMEDGHKCIPYLLGNTAGEAVLFAEDPEDAGVERQIHAMEVGNRVFAYLQDKVRRDPVYLYRFDRDLPGTDPKDTNPAILKGSFHSSELWYVFHTLSRCWRPMTGVDYDLSSVMNKYWANFAKTGDPNGPGLPAWEKFTVGNQAYMYLGDIQEMRRDDIPKIRREMIEKYVSEAIETHLNN